MGDKAISDWGCRESGYNRQVEGPDTLEKGRGNALRVQRRSLDRHGGQSVCVWGGRGPCVWGRHPLGETGMSLQRVRKGKDGE